MNILTSKAKAISKKSTDMKAKHLLFANPLKIKPIIKQKNASESFLSI